MFGEVAVVEGRFVVTSELYTAECGKDTHTHTLKNFLQGHTDMKV